MTDMTPPQINQKLRIHTWWFTALLIAVNVSLFGWQILSGVNITDPSPLDAIAWGADLRHLHSYLSLSAYLLACFSILDSSI